MSRPLRPGLIAEGDSDCAFLLPVIDRQLEAILLAHPKADCELQNVIKSSCVKKHGKDRFTQAAKALADQCHVVFVHADHNEEHEAAGLAGKIGQRPHHTVIVIPKRETEAWALADPGAFRRVRGANLSLLPKDPREVERIPDPKAVLRDVLQGSGPADLTDHLGRLGQAADLTILSKVPAYAGWRDRTEVALKGMRYL